MFTHTPARMPMYSYLVMAHIVIVYILTAYEVVAYIVMAYTSACPHAHTSAYSRMPRASTLSPFFIFWANLLWVNLFWANLAAECTVRPLKDAATLQRLSSISETNGLYSYGPYSCGLSLISETNGLYSYAHIVMASH